MSDSKEMPLTRRGHDNKVLGRSGRPLLVVVEGVNIIESNISNATTSRHKKPTNTD
jgi:hypothetical protein